MNKVILMGRLTADPELRQTQSGISSCRFTIAVNRKYADKQSGERQADFISCVAWRQTAEFVTKYFTKGSMICVEGNLRTSTYDDKNHPDVKHYATDVYVDNVEFCGSKNENGGGSQQNGNYNNSYQPAPQQTAPQAANNENMSYGNLSDFEEIMADGDVPF